MNENRQEQNKKSKKRGILGKIILAILIIILLLLGYRCAVSRDDDKTLKDTNVASLDYEDEVDAITEIDLDKRQEAVNAKVEEGMMNVNYSPNAVFKGKVSQNPTGVWRD